MPSRFLAKMKNKEGTFRKRISLEVNKHIAIEYTSSVTIKQSAIQIEASSVEFRVTWHDLLSQERNYTRI